MSVSASGTSTLLCTLLLGVVFHVVFLCAVLCSVVFLCVVSLWIEIAGNCLTPRYSGSNDGLKFAVPLCSCGTLCFSSSVLISLVNGC